MGYMYKRVVEKVHMQNSANSKYSFAKNGRKKGN